ncbi:MAG: hypothetical protein WDM81_02220 [Rhizomicrobium sp.]
MASAGDLQTHRPLPGHNPGVVERLDQGRTAALHDRARDGLAVVGQAIVEDDLGAEPAGAGDLRGRGVFGHDDDGGQAEQRRRRGHPLRMIAGGKRDHAAGALVRRYLEHGVDGAAKLERPGVLEHFGLEEDAAADAGVELPVLEQRRAYGVRRDPSGGGFDIGENGNGHGGPLQQ